MNDHEILVTLDRIAEEVSEINDNVRILLNKKLGTRSRKPTPEDRLEDGIDEGKVVALRTAGWSYQKIAEEMECSKSAIVHILKEYLQ